MEKNLGTRATSAAIRHLERFDYEILARDHMGYTVAMDGGTLVFVKVEHGFDGFPEGEPDQGAFEEAATRYLAENGLEPEYAHIRLDHVLLWVVREDWALVRHEVNCLGRGF